MLILEALRALYGDSLILHFGTEDDPRMVIVDGGPPAVFADALQPRLAEIRDERELAEGTPLPIDLMMVSHIDEDHVGGLLAMVRKIKDLRDARQAVPWRIRRFWHNSFDDILDNADASIAEPASVMSTATIGGLLKPEGSLILASVGQGRELRKLLEALQLGGNPELSDNPDFPGLLMAGHAPIDLDGLTLTVVAPSRENLSALREDWKEKIQPILKKEKSAANRAQIASYVDKSVYNLSSLVVLVEASGKRVLLTGDGRGDHTLAGLAAAGRLDADGRIEVDVLKVPHHGSDRDVTVDYFQRIRATHYVISADGKYDNPDVDTLAMISQARPDDAFTIHLTYPLDGFAVPAIGKQVADFFAAEKAAGRKYAVETRAANGLSLRLQLA